MFKDNQIVLWKKLHLWSVTEVRILKNYILYILYNLYNYVVKKLTNYFTLAVCIHTIYIYIYIYNIYNYIITNLCDSLRLWSGIIIVILHSLGNILWTPYLFHFSSFSFYWFKSSPYCSWVSIG